MVLIGPNEIQRAASTFLRYPDIPSDPVIATTYLGTPIYDNLVIPSDGNEGLNLFEDWVINDVLMRIDRSKRIIRTQVQGRDGDVNEFISNADFSVSFRGFFVNENQKEWPIDPATLMNYVGNYAGEIAVASEFLSVFEIESIIIDRYEVAQVDGYRNILAFVWECRSEDPIELQIKSGENVST